MKRPSRGERASATTKRYVGCFLAPMRRSLIFTMSSFYFGLAQHSERKLCTFFAAETHLLHHLARFFEAFDQAIHVGDLGPAALRDALAARTVEDIRVLPLPSRHRTDNRFDALDVGFRNFEVLGQRTRYARDHFQDVGHRSQLANDPGRIACAAQGLRNSGSRRQAHRSDYLFDDATGAAEPGYPQRFSPQAHRARQRDPSRRRESLGQTLRRSAQDDEADGFRRQKTCKASARNAALTQSRRTTW